MANAFGVRVNPHVWGTGVGLAASLHLIAALLHNPPPLEPLEPLLEFDCSDHPARMAVLRSPIVQREGRVDVPQGLGIEIDRASRGEITHRERTCSAVMKPVRGGA